MVRSPYGVTDFFDIVAEIIETISIHNQPRLCSLMLIDLMKENCFTFKKKVRQEAYNTQ